MLLLGSNGLLTLSPLPCEQICEGVKHMHNCNLAHRDIKPHNVLLAHRDEMEEGLAGDDELIPVLEAIPENDDVPGGLGSPGWERHVCYRAVLTDFGSVGPATVHVADRAQALALQEEAQVRRVPVPFSFSVVGEQQHQRYHLHSQNPTRHNCEAAVCLCTRILNTKRGGPFSAWRHCGGPGSFILIKCRREV